MVFVIHFSGGGGAKWSGRARVNDPETERSREARRKSRKEDQMLYHIQFDHISYWVEAADIRGAVDVWKRHVAKDWGAECDGSEEPESIALISEESVIRETFATAIQEETYIDRSRWPQGIWDKEPDRVRWTDEKTGILCLAVRSPHFGHWCGYVGLQEGHQLHGKDYNHTVPEPLSFKDAKIGKRGIISVVTASLAGEGNVRLDVLFDVHGSLTFAGTYNKEDPNIWWLGFDCSHFQDYAPGQTFKSLGDGDYRDLQYVKEECASLAKQISDYGGTRGIASILH